MPNKTVKQTAIEYFAEPTLSKADIKAMEAKIFPAEEKFNLFNVFSFIPRKAFATVLFFLLLIPGLLIGQNILMDKASLTVDARNFTSNIYQQAQNNIVYLEIYSDNVDETAVSQVWYDSTSGYTKNAAPNSGSPVYSYMNNTSSDSRGEISYDTIQSAESANVSDFPNMPEMSAFMRALGTSTSYAESIQSVAYKGEPAYMISILNADGVTFSDVYFIKNTNVVYIVNATFTRKVIYTFIKPDATNQNMIFNSNQ